MPKITDTNCGVYILELFAENSFYIANRKFNHILLSKGYHYYIGSAQKNLNQRLERHFKKDKKNHWHIDFLTSNENVRPNSALILHKAPKSIEEEIANNFISFFNAKIILKGFGNSDTKGTITHLFYRSKKITYNQFSERYQSIVRFRLSSKV